MPQDKAAMADRGIPQKFEVCPADEKILGIGRDFEQWYAQLKTQSPCNKNTCTLSCRTRNTGAQVCGPTATRWNAISCHPNNRTAIFPTVSHGFAAHIELLRRYCGERGRCTIGSVTQQWSTSNQGTYAAFVSRVAGMPANQVFNPNDIDLMGRLALAMSCFEAGSLPYSVAELKQGLIMAGGGARVPVPANVGQLLNESLTGSYAANPVSSPNSHPGSWSYPPSSISGNNYMPPQPPASPLPIINSSGVNTTNPSGTNPGTNPQISNYPNTSAGAANVVFPPASSIIAQPKSVKRGAFVVVSWTSVGMSIDTPCQIFASSTMPIAQGNEGTQIITTDASSTATTMTFTQQCQSQTGTDVQKTASVTLY
ncbi:MAG: hypothetical protein Q8R25_00510 [bacterium]|nr:hypothetical protein [bacterium]